MLLIDIFLLILIVYFGFKGYNKGILYTLMRLISGVLAILVAIHFSGWIANKLFDTENETLRFILPSLSFIITLFLVAIALSILFKILITPINKSPLSFLNKILGAVLNVAFISLMFGSVIWILHSMDVIKNETLETSYVSKYLFPIIPTLFEVLGDFIPFLKNAFLDLNEYFKELSIDLEKS